MTLWTEVASFVFFVFFGSVSFLLAFADAFEHPCMLTMLTAGEISLFFYYLNRIVITKDDCWKT